MSVPLANPQVTVNNEAVAIVPNSVTYTEGFGEQTMRAASAGGASVEQVFSQNIETNFSMVKFEVYNDPQTIALVRSWKVAGNQNVVTVTGTVVDGISVNTLLRTFSKAAILNDFEVALGADTTIEVEFKSDAAV